MLTAGFFTFDRSWNLYTSLSKNSMSRSAHLYGGLIKCKGWVVLFQTSQKKRLFHILWQPYTLEDNLTIWSPFLHPSKKGLSFPFSLGKKRISGNSVERRGVYSVLICFENCQGVPCTHWQSKNRMINTFIIVNITPICNR